MTPLCSGVPLARLQSALLALLLGLVLSVHALRVPQPKLRVYVVEPPTLAQRHHEFVSDGTLEDAFGTALSARDVVRALTPMHNNMSAAALETLALLARRGWLFDTNEYRMAAMMHLRLWLSPLRVTSITDADVVFAYGCTRNYAAFYQQESRLLRNGTLSHRLPRFHFSSRWWRESYEKHAAGISREACDLNSNTLVSLIDRYEDCPSGLACAPWVMACPTGVHAPLHLGWAGNYASVFPQLFNKSTQTHRTHLLAFQGSIDRSWRLKRYRKRLVRELQQTPSSALVQRGRVLGLNDLFFTPNLASGQRRSDYFNPGLTMLATYLDSQFCLQPPGDTDLRRAMFDCMLMGGIPVILELQRRAMDSVLAGIWIKHDHDHSNQEEGLHAFPSMTASESSPSMGSGRSAGRLDDVVVVVDTDVTAPALYTELLGRLESGWVDAARARLGRAAHRLQLSTPPRDDVMRSQRSSSRSVTLHDHAGDPPDAMDAAMTLLARTLPKGNTRTARWGG
ncbi:hypothetical protein PTSG_05662 [Salpingoeca rosetta]|uniref:Exostosin GT47 domain-containing protein n=1 Tax=Salpingoeca rosetta (strain ATCC 50818 / BSB-021) TaxID=946362 RepID=F2UBV2_SALR5|nr:uncharacterized protein PTSG_05662 [Salpingoeca rosetta]EGD73968.1 hypothetical protein PTSG_05662 [Salpingoeca rosetta]|eukprot:XP_004993531.1 hypothetical protein PTSG_05662 [Salpingoeca rosetta]